jgi:hypothetical protein
MVTPLVRGVASLEQELVGTPPLRRRAASATAHLSRSMNSASSIPDFESALTRRSVPDAAANQTVTRARPR